MYVTASPAQNQNSSFVSHFPKYFPTDIRDSTVTGRELASPYEAGKGPLTLIGPLVKNKDKHRKVTDVLRVPLTDESHYHPRALPISFRLPPQNFQHWLMLRGKASVIQNPNCCYGNRQLHQHLPNLPKPVNHNVVLRPLNGSSEVKTLQLTNPPLVPFGKMAALTAICPFRTYVKHSCQRNVCCK